jgi:hypothetical protein
MSEWHIISELFYRLASVLSYLLALLLFSLMVTSVNNEAAQSQTTAIFILTTPHNSLLAIIKQIGICDFLGLVHRQNILTATHSRNWT